MEVLGVAVDDLTMEEALARIEDFIRSGRPHQVVTANPEMVMRSRRDPELAAILREAALVTADGVGIVWASRQLSKPPNKPSDKPVEPNTPLAERITGVELTTALLKLAAAAGYRVFLLGAAGGVAEEAARRVMAAYPGLKVAGVQHGYFRPDEEPAVVRKIFQAQPEILLVGLGSPRQEKWIRHHLHELGTPVCIGVGGTLDILAGMARRAPGWMQRSGLEWLYRLWRQPARIGRMLAIPKFMAAVLMERFRGRR
ncbi:MAG: WecB/TagA/CpsF family glycosyltransferase [Syntrophothermus sp.]